MTRSDYEKKFRSFPDVVTLNEFRAMLGGISECTARKLINQNHVKHFYIRCTFYIYLRTLFQRMYAKKKLTFSG